LLRIFCSNLVAPLSTESIDAMPRRQLGARRILLVLLTAVLFASLPARADVVIRPPLKNLCQLPPSADSTRGHVLLRYVRNSNGKINAVVPVYVDLRPEEYAEPILSALTRCLKEHKQNIGRFFLDVPSFEGFHFFETAGPGTPRQKVGDGKLMPRPWLQDMISAKLDLGRTLLEGRSFKTVEGTGWTLLTDALEGEREEIVKAVETTLKGFDMAFRGEAEVLESASVTLLVFRDHEDFQRFEGFDTVMPAHGPLAGRYRSWERIIYGEIRRDRPLAWLTGKMAHEVAHHLVAQSLVSEPGSVPYWVHEGIAKLFQCLDRNGDPLDLAGLDRTKETRGMRKWKAPALVYLKILRELERKGKLFSFLDLPADYAAVSLVDLLAELEVKGKSFSFLHLPINPEAAGTAKVLKVTYASPWMAVHFLVNAEGGKYRAPFQQWILDDSGEKTPESLASALGLPLFALDAKLAEHFKRIR
jgi:hypothetical protein